VGVRVIASETGQWEMKLIIVSSFVFGAIWVRVPITLFLLIVIADGWKVTTGETLTLSEGLKTLVIMSFDCLGAISVYLKLKVKSGKQTLKV
jgi:presenilin-like A22 family membrane protease